MIAANDSHAGSLTLARRGTGGHPQTPGLVAPLHPARWAPSSPAWDKTAGPRQLWVAGLAQGVVHLPELGNWTHLQNPGLAGPEHSDAERPAPHLGQDGRALRLWVAGLAQGVATLAGIGGHLQTPAWRHLNHGLLRGQLAGRGQHSRPELRDCGSPDSRKGDGSFVCAARRTQGKLPGQRARRRTARVATPPRCGEDRRPVP